MVSELHCEAILHSAWNGPTLMLGIASVIVQLLTFGIELVARGRRRLFTGVSHVEFRMTSLSLHHIWLIRACVARLDTATAVCPDR